MARLSAAYRRLKGVEALLNTPDQQDLLTVAEEAEQTVLRMIAEYQALPAEERARWDELDETGEAWGEDDPATVRFLAAIEAVSKKQKAQGG